MAERLALCVEPGLEDEDSALGGQSFGERVTLPTDVPTRAVSAKVLWRHKWSCSWLSEPTCLVDLIPSQGPRAAGREVVREHAPRDRDRR